MAHTCHIYICIWRISPKVRSNQRFSLSQYGRPDQKAQDFLKFLDWMRLSYFDWNLTSLRVQVFFQSCEVSWFIRFRFLPSHAWVVYACGHSYSWDKWLWAADTRLTQNNVFKTSLVLLCCTCGVMILLARECRILWSQCKICCQVICDADLLFINVVARWPGSVHDAKMLHHPPLFPAFEGPRPPLDGVILGDSGYMLRTWLMTPVANPTTRQERRYNFAQSSTRTTVERCIGVAKQRWNCLRCGLRLEPAKACRVIIVCDVAQPRTPPQNPPGSTWFLRQQQQ